jgi:hypothetical protein
MAKKIGWTEQAKADVRGIDREIAIDLLHRLARFLSNEEGDVKRLADKVGGLGCLPHIHVGRRPADGELAREASENDCSID